MSVAETHRWGMTAASGLYSLRHSPHPEVSRRLNSGMLTLSDVISTIRLYHHDALRQIWSWGLWWPDGGSAVETPSQKTSVGPIHPIWPGHLGQPAHEAGA